MVDKFHEECGVVGVYGPDEASTLVYLSLYALQHRGRARGCRLERRGADAHRV
jgi:amidophosphoribosyltransferase